MEVERAKGIAQKLAEQRAKAGILKRASDKARGRFSVWKLKPMGDLNQFSPQAKQLLGRANAAQAVYDDYKAEVNTFGPKDKTDEGLIRVPARPEFAKPGKDMVGRMLEFYSGLPRETSKPFKPKPNICDIFEQPMLKPRKPKPKIAEPDPLSCYSGVQLKWQKRGLERFCNGDLETYNLIHGLTPTQIEFRSNLINQIPQDKIDETYYHHARRWLCETGALRKLDHIEYGEGDHIPECEEEEPKLSADEIIAIWSGKAPPLRLRKKPKKFRIKREKVKPLFERFNLPFRAHYGQIMDLQEFELSSLAELRDFRAAEARVHREKDKQIERERREAEREHKRREREARGPLMRAKPTPMACDPIHILQQLAKTSGPDNATTEESLRLAKAFTMLLDST